MTYEANTKTALCPVCKQGPMTEFYSRQNVPVHMHTLFSTQKDATDIDRGSIVLAFCEFCGFVSNIDFDLSKMHYDSTYDNSQTYSETYVKYMDELANQLLFQKGIQNSTIVEVGCGSGFFLRKLVENKNVSNTGIGFDPAYRGPETELDGRLRFERKFYDQRSSNTKADVVICRHVIEHVPDPFELLMQIKAALCESLDARVFFETPCFEWVLNNKAYWDICYEHCSCFSKNSLQAVFNRAGFKIESIDRIFGDQYLWIEAKADMSKNFQNQGDITKAAMDYAANESLFVAKTKQQLRKLDGNTAIWGAGAKGVSLANLIDPQRQLFDCLVDLNPQKQSGYIPGTGHPIVSYRDLPKRGVKNALLMNPNYRDENLQILKNNGQSLQLFDIGSDFV